jgi:hypothetical protein
VQAQLSTELGPETLAAFKQYVAKVESGLDQRDEGGKPFLWLDENPKQRAKARRGEIVVHQFGDEIIEVEDGLIHHWLGAVFLPGVTLEDVATLLHDFKNHVKYYPEVVAAELTSKEGDIFHHRMRTQVKKVLTVVLDMDLEAHHRTVDDKRYAVRSYTTRVSEVKDSGSPEENVLPDGKGSGFMWRLYSYWRLEETEDGVLAELETVSLSRGIPFGLGWVIKPFVKDVPQESLISTLSSTRSVLTK